MGQDSDAVAAAGVTFVTEDSAVNVHDFYTSSLPEGGWDLTQDVEINGKYLLTAQRDGLIVSVMIPSTDGPTTQIYIFSRREG